MRICNVLLNVFVSIMIDYGNGSRRVVSKSWLEEQGVRSSNQVSPLEFQRLGISNEDYRTHIN